MRTMRIRLSCFCFWLFLAGLAAPLVAQGASTEGIFLTRAEEKEVQGTDKKLWVPTSEKIAFAWSDTPFAVHIPFEMETETIYITDYIGAPKHSQICSKDYVLKLFLKGFTAIQGNQPIADTLNVLATGLYRRDGQKILPQDRDLDYIDKYRYSRDLPRLLNLELEPGQEIYPVRLGGGRCSGTMRVVFWVVIDPALDRRTKWRNKPEDNSYYTVDTAYGIKHWSLFGEKTEGKLVADLQVLEGEPAKPSDGPLADSPTNKKPRQVMNSEYDVTVKQNGWVLQSGQTKVLGEWNQKMLKAEETTEDWRLQDTGTQIVGTTLTSGHKLVGQRLDNPSQVMTTEVTIRIDLPQKLWDNQPGEGKVTISRTGADPHWSLHSWGLSRTSANVDDYLEWSPISLAVYAFDPQAGVKKPLAFWLDICPFEVNEKQFQISEMRWKPDTRAAFKGDTLPFSWTAADRVGSHLLLALDIRYAVGSNADADFRQLPPATLPQKHAEFFATRLSEMENNVIGQTSEEAPSQPSESPSDDYYEWLAEFSTRIFPDVQAQLGEIRSQLTALAAIEEAYVQKFQTLMVLDYQAFKGLSENKDLLDHMWNQLRQQRDTSLDPTVTATALAALRREREEIRVQKAAIPALKQQLIDEGLKIMKQVVETVDVKGISYNERHPEHKETLNYVKDRYELLRLELYDAAKQYDVDGFSKIMNELGFGPKSEDEVRQLLRAKAALHRVKGYERRMAVAAMSPNGLAPGSDGELHARAARVEALDAVEAVLKINPVNKEALFIRKALEVTFLEAIAAKLEYEKKASLMVFQKFFEERGFMTEDPGGWWTGFFESIYAWTGMGPVSSILGWAKACELEAATDIQQSSIAKHHISLLAIRKLVRNDMPLSKVRTVTPEEMAAGMALVTPMGLLLPVEKIRRMCNDIHETFAELGDLRALAEGRREEFLELHPRAYYNLINPEKSRVEFWSDFFFSPLSLIGWFGPGAIAKVEGSWQWFKLTTTAEHIALLEDIGEVQRSGQWFYQAMKLDSVGKKIRALPGASMISEILAQDAAYIKGMDTGYKWLNSGLQMANSGARLMGTLMLYGGLFVAADATNIPALKLFCDVIAQIGVGDMAYHFLSHAGVPVEKALQKLDEFAEFMVKKRREIAEHGELIAELEKIQQKLAKANQEKKGGLDPETIKQIEDLLAKYEKSTAAKPGTIKLAPGTAVETDTGRTIRVAAEALKKGDAKQAESALKGAKKMHEAMTAQAEAVVKKLDEAREILKKYGEPQPFIHEPTRFKPILEVPQPENFILGKNLNPDHPVHAFLLRGDDAVRMGDLEAAETIYKAAQKLSEGTNHLETVNSRLDLMLCARDYAKNLEKKRLKPWSTKFDAPMRESEQELSAKLNGLTKDMKAMSKGANAICQVVDKATGQTLVFKAVADEEMVLREVMGSALFNALGGKAPTARRVRKVTYPVFDDEGNLLRYAESDGIVYHFAEGKEVGKLTEPEVLALKDELAPLRAFRLWLCDTDAHMRNFMFSPNGHVIPIDFGYAHMRRNLDHPLCQGCSKASNQKEFMEEVLRYRKMVNDVGIHPDEGWNTLYGWIERVDGMLSYDEMEDMVKSIQKVCKNKDELRAMLEKAFAPDAAPPGLIDEAVETLVARGEVLEDVLKKRFKKYKQTADAKSPTPIPIAAVFMPQNGSDRDLVLPDAA